MYAVVCVHGVRATGDPETRLPGESASSLLTHSLPPQVGILAVSETSHLEAPSLLICCSSYLLRLSCFPVYAQRTARGVEEVTRGSEAELSPGLGFLGHAGHSARSFPPLSHFPWETPRRPVSLELTWLVGSTNGISSVLGAWLGLCAYNRGRVELGGRWTGRTGVGVRLRSRLGNPGND